MQLKFFKRLIFGAGIFSIISNFGIAQAIQYQNSNVYRAQEQTTSGLKTVVYFHGTPGSKLSVKLGSSDRATAKIAGACGEVRIPVPTTGSFEGLKVDDVPVDATSLPIQGLPSCLNGSFSEPRTSNFKTPTGQIIIIGKTVGAAVKVSLPSESSKVITINACGFGVLKASASQEIPDSFIVGTETYSLSNLANAGTGPICKTTNDTATGFVPASWMP